MNKFQTVSWVTEGGKQKVAQVVDPFVYKVLCPANWEIEAGKGVQSYI